MLGGYVFRVQCDLQIVPCLSPHIIQQTHKRPYTTNPGIAVTRMHTGVSTSYSRRKL